MNKGHFIVLEGPDGSGTTTHAKILADRLRSEGRDVVLTAEPTESEIGLFIREQLKKKTIPSPSALQLLFCADRASHIETVIKPALAAGKTVISDRYVISTLVYGEALGLNPEWLLQVNTPFLEPDIMIVALPAFHVCKERVLKREQLEVFENVEFMQKIWDLYDRVIADDSTVKHVDTGGELDDAKEMIYRIVNE